MHLPGIITRFGCPPKWGRLIDLGEIDFDALAKYFKLSQNKRSTVASMASLLENKVSQMVHLNPSRIALQDRLRSLIDAYNAGSHNVDEFFKQLQDFVKELTEEEQRTVKEGLTEEELAVYDLLLKPGPALTKKERQTVKLLARVLLEKLKAEKLVIDWRKYSRRRAAVRGTIEDALENLPESYTDDLWDQKCAVVYNHVFESYYGEGRSRYMGIVH